MIRRKVPWTSQPQTLTQVRRDVRLSFAANYISNAAPDLISGRLPTVGGTVVPSPFGLGVKLSATTDTGIIYSNNAVIPASSAAFTVIVIGTWAAETRLSDLFFYGDESGGNYPQHSLILNADSTNFNTATSGIFSAFTYDGGFQTTIKSTAGVIDGKPHTIGWRNGTNAALSLWMDGRDVSSTKTGGTYTLSSTYPVYVNQTNVTANGRGVTSPTSGVFVFPRILSDGEMALYTRNPNLLFFPQERRVFVSVAGGTAANVNLVGVGVTGSAGTITAKGRSSTSITSTGTTGSAGTAAATGKGSVSITSSGASGGVGTVTSSGKANASISSSAATGSAGTTTETGKATVSISSSAATGSAGVVTASGPSAANVNLVGVGVSGLAGTVTAQEIPLSTKVGGDDVPRTVRTLKYEPRKRKDNFGNEIIDEILKPIKQIKQIKHVTIVKPEKQAHNIIHAIQHDESDDEEALLMLL